MRSALRAAALAALVLLAGCAGGVDMAAQNADDGTLDDGTDGTPADVESSGTDAGSTADGDAGTVDFYISDRPEAIDEFRHLNVTVSRVGIQRAGENGSWVEHEVGNRTVDLTRLRGANATLIGEYPLANGTYSKVFVYVREVNGTLTNGERVTVKLPSEKLHLNKPFEVGPNESVDFVFDIAVHKAGKSGKYILRPVIAESGTDVPIEAVDDRAAADRGDGDAGTASDATEGDLNVTVVGNVTRGENATVEVTDDGSAVSNATVSVNGERVGTTDAAGRLTFAVPGDAEELEVAVVAADGAAEGELAVGVDEAASGGSTAEDGNSGEADGNGSRGSDGGN